VPEGAVTVKVEAAGDVLEIVSVMVLVPELKAHAGGVPLVLMAATLHERETVPV
jgi:hypothetical protein